MRALTVDEVGCVSGGAEQETQLEEVGVVAHRKKPDQYFLLSCGMDWESGWLTPEDIFSGLYDKCLRSLRYSTRDWDMTRSDSNAAVKHISDISPEENHLLFEQASGDLYVIDPDGGLRLVAEGYSGAVGAGINNPVYEDMRNVGPTPRGTYAIGPHEPTRGPITLQLTAISQVNDRSGLLIHGDNSATHDASDGCIILDKVTREQISNLDHAVLEVVTHVPAARVYISR